METASASLTANSNAAMLPGTKVHGWSLQCGGTWLRIARIQDEAWLEDLPAAKPEELLRVLSNSGLKPDLFTFAQSIPDEAPKFDYHLEWDNLAVASTSDFPAWWEGLPQESRKNVRRAERRGLVVKTVEFSDELVHGIKDIYDETPIRQGRRFWHYRKELETVRRENSSYVDRGQFIGAYVHEELVGFIKMVYVGQTARIMQILSKNAHADKRPTNALLAKAVEICSQRPVGHLIYGQYIYDNKADSPVTEFKRRNGFHQVLLPRYYIPLTAKGRLALNMRLHRGLKALLPGGVVSRLLKVRQVYYERTLLRQRNPA
jgi:hypothetical protein